MDNELKHYLDEQFKTLVSKGDLQLEIKTLKTVISEQTTELKTYADEQTEKLAGIIAETIAAPMQENFSELKDYKQVREEVLILKSDMQKIKTALHLA